MPEFRGKKNNIKTDKFVLLKRRKEVVELFLTGRSQWEVALYLRENGWPSITQASVSMDLEWMDKRWLEEIGDDYRNKVKAQEIARLRLIQSMAFDSFAKSCMDHVSEKRTTEKAPKFIREAEQPTKGMEKKLGRKFTKIRGKPVPVLDDNGEEEMRVLKEVVEISKSGSAGDPRWLSLAKDCSETILKIYGVGKEEKGNTLIVNNWWDSLFGRDESQDEKPLENRIKELPAPDPIPIEPLPSDTIDAGIVESDEDEMTLEQAMAESQVEESNGS